MIVVTGATGKLGELVMEALLRTVPPAQLAVAVRNPAKASHLAARGVQVRHADYDRPETLPLAFGRTDKVLLISANEVGKRANQHLAVVDAARHAGVGLLAYTSLLRADSSGLALAEEHRMTEETIRGSRVPYVFLRNSWYIENHTEQLEGILRRGSIAGAAGDGRFASATRRDFAEAAAAVLTLDLGDNTTYELAGDYSFTLAEFAGEVSRQSGRNIAYVDLPPDRYKSILLEAGLPELYADVLVDSDIAASRGELDSDSDDLRRLIGRPATPLRDAVATALNNLRPVAPAAPPPASR